MINPIQLILISIIFLIPHFLRAQSGYLKFEFNENSVHVVVDNNFFDPKIVASGDSIRLEAGTRIIKYFTPYHKSATMFIPVYQDSTANVKYNFSERRINSNTITGNIAARQHFDANVMIITDDDSEIYYKGSYKGTGFAAFNTIEEIGTIEIKNPDFGANTKKLSVKSREINYIENYIRPDPKFARIYSFIPGVSQAYKKEFLKTVVFGVSTVGIITFAAVKTNQYKDERKIFYQYQVDYNGARSEQEALRLGDLAESQRNLVTRIDNQRRLILVGGFLVYAYNIYDAFTSKPKGGFLNRDKDLEFYLSQEQVSGQLNTTGTVRYNF